FLSQRVLAVVLLGVNIADVIRYRRLIRDTNSSSIGHQHRWVMSIVIISLISTIFPTFWIPISWLLGLEAGTIAANLVAGSIVFAYLLSLIVITLQYSRQTLAVAAPTLAPDPPKDNTPDQQAAEQAQVRELYQRVRQLFESERLFEAPDLRLSTVAKQLETSARSVSQAINTCGGKNFYEFVNDFRIRAAQHILEQSEDQQLTMQEVMYDVGYSSKSSFNKEFKKKTGLTPLQYRKKMSTNTRIRTV
ncbi:MAG: helix-turn-helix domain-containing protein, partial [Bacteroidota bacterium]